jgi:glycosyltransferase involved in cell wall biosynthesis
VYKNLLNKSKAMIFLCEHETQGMAYQEALASNVPIIAWDHGWWTDPVWQAYSEIPIPATSVPLFSRECGEKFKMIKDLPKTFEKFWSKLDSYNLANLFKERYHLKNPLIYTASIILVSKNETMQSQYHNVWFINFSGIGNGIVIAPIL